MSVVFLLLAVGVALRKESVDRNFIVVALRHIHGVSLSARRAWIEIKIPRAITDTGLSLSARRAWIEMMLRGEGLILSGSRSPQGERG